MSDEKMPDDKRAGYATITKARLRNLEADRKRLRFIFDNTICYQYITENGEEIEVDINSRKAIDKVMKS